MAPYSKRLLVCVSILASFGSTSVLAAQSCNSKLRFNPGAGSLITSFDPLTFYPARSSRPIIRGRSSGAVTLGLAYILPAHQFNSGAFLVKARHKLAPSPKNAASPATSLRNQKISLHRPHYRSPCSSQEKTEYNFNPSAEKYIDYHYYQERDRSFPQDDTRNLDNFHADVGFRPENYRAWSAAGCMRTSDPNIRPQFLYDERRQEATPIQKIARPLGKVAAKLQLPRAYADERSYTEYVDIQSSVIPYSKLPSQSGCVEFNVQVPKGTVSSEIMIVDADIAAVSFVGAGSSDPQSSWEIQWQ